MEGSNVYQFDGSVVLAIGRQVPGPGEPLQRGECRSRALQRGEPENVALVLSGPAMGAWREAAREVVEGLEFATHLYPVADRQGEVYVISCYAPTRAASRAQKDQFYDDFQQALTAISSDEMYVLLSDFNARVGSRLGNDDPCSLVQGSHGYGECNDGGRELLAFLSSNEAVVCKLPAARKIL